MLDLLVPVGAGALLGGVLALVVVVTLVVALLRARAAAGRERAAARDASRTVDELRAEVADIRRRLAEPAPDGHTGADRSGYVITHLGDEDPPRHAAGEEPRLEPALFADLVLRESVVRAASLAHGVRVALAPETRNRIRFEVRREVRRARKQRRAETKLARRAIALRQREARPDDEDAA